MSSPTVAFRISNEHLARALRAIRTIEPAWQLTTPANLIKVILNDFISKAEAKHKITNKPEPSIMAEIAQARASLNKKSDTLPQLNQIK